MVGASGRRIKLPAKEDTTSGKFFGDFRFVDISYLQDFLDIASICGHCKQGKLTMREDFSKKMALGSFLTVECRVLYMLSRVRDIHLSKM